MTTESDIFDTLKGLVSNRVYPDVAPLGATKPYLTYQGVGGTSTVFLDNTLPNKRRPRVQFNSWATTRAAAMLLIRQAEVALCAASSLRANPLGEPVSIYEEDTGLYGARQDFELFSTR